MPDYFEFEVSLKDIKPRIWRRFLLRHRTTFRELHDAIQDAFGWGDSHLWEFTETGRERNSLAGIPNDDDPWDSPAPDATKVKAAQFFTKKGDKCLYTYDFGDNWEHEVKLRGIVSDKTSFKRRLLAGKRSCPPDDCGSVTGYYRMCEVVTNGKDPYGEDPKELREWLGEWQPDAFILEQAQKFFED